MRFTRSDRGQALVELALVLPILIFLLLAIMEGGRLFAGYLELQNAAREGARSAAIGRSDVEAAVYASKQLHLLDPSSPDFQVIIDPPTTPPDEPNLRETGDQVAIMVYHKVFIGTPLISDLLGNPFPLEALVVMRVE